MSTWETDAGGFFDEGEVTLTKARFGFDSDYMDGDVLVFILEGEDDEGAEFRSLYAIGNGWESEDRGKKVVGLEKFRDNCNYAFFFNAALKTDAKEILVERGYPDNATIWEGLVFEMANQKVTHKIGEKEVESNVVLPTKFVGEAGGSKKKSASKAKKTSNSGSKASKALVAKVRKLAKQHDDHDDFLAAVVEEVPDIEEYDDLWESVLDESGIWAEAR